MAGRWRTACPRRSTTLPSRPPGSIGCTSRCRCRRGPCMWRSTASSSGFSGANVTMPHKTEAAGLIDHLSDDAKVLQAVNTIIVRGEELEGHNTDVAGSRSLPQTRRWIRPRREVGPDVREPAGPPGPVRSRSVERGSTSSPWSRAPLRAAPRVDRRRDRPHGGGGRGPRTGGDLDLVVNATPVGTESDMPFDLHPSCERMHRGGSALRPRSRRSSAGQGSRSNAVQGPDTSSSRRRCPSSCGPARPLRST